MIRKIFLVVCFIISAIHGGCKDEAVDPIELTNLISNSSFEQNGQPSLEGWTLSFPDTIYYQFSTDVPHRGGGYSLSLMSYGISIPAASATIKATPGFHSYRLKTFGKAKPGNWVPGQIGLALKTRDSLVARTSLTFSDTSWTEYALSDTISAGPTDSIVIWFSPGFSHLDVVSASFDLVEFVELE